MLKQLGDAASVDPCVAVKASLSFQESWGRERDQQVLEVAAAGDTLLLSSRFQGRQRDTIINIFLLRG